MVRMSDIIIPEFSENRILISKHEYYGKHSTRVKKYAKLVSDSVSIIKQHKLIKFHPKLIIRIGIDERHFDGVHYDEYKVIELRPTWNKVIFLQILCHEMIHSEQHYMGRYKNYALSDFGFWKGKRYELPIADISTKANLDRYLKAPWEKEAYNRQGELACEVMGLLKEKENEIRNI